MCLTSKPSYSEQCGEILGRSLNSLVDENVVGENRRLRIGEALQPLLGDDPLGGKRVVRPIEDVAEDALMKAQKFEVNIDRQNGYIDKMVPDSRRDRRRALGRPRRCSRSAAQARSRSWTSGAGSEEPPWTGLELVIERTFAARNKRNKSTWHGAVGSLG